jgi:hypothetical protein
VHHTVLTFVANTIFEKIMGRYDYFGLLTMRSGHQPFSAIPLEQKKMNIEMKRSQLRELNITHKMEMKPSNELAEALIQAFIDAKSLPITSTQKGKVTYKGPFKWVVALVGPQMQNLKKFRAFMQEELIDAQHTPLNSKTDINLIIIGINITDIPLQENYKEICAKTAEGFFVNLDFSPRNQFWQYMQTGVAGADAEMSI